MPIKNVTFYKQYKIETDKNYGTEGKDIFGNACYTNLILEEKIQIPNQLTTFTKYNDFIQYIKSIFDKYKNDNDKLCIDFEIEEKDKNKHNKYQGEIDRYGNRSGMCKKTDYISGDTYIGEMNYGIEYGKGTLISKKGYKYVGSMVEGQFTETGIKLFNNGTKAEGEWWHDEIQSGKFTYPDGTVINVERENQQIKYTLNGVDVSNIFLSDGDFNGSGKITWQNITDGSKVEYDAKWKNNKSVVDETTYPSLLLIKDGNDVVKHKYQTTTILKRKDIKSTPPKRLCPIPCANKDILWMTCCRLECAQDLNNLNSDDKKAIE